MNEEPLNARKMNEETAQSIVRINVGGKPYQTTRSTFDGWDNTMMAMLMRHHHNQELFIDRDSKMFRWILHWYRTGVLVDHTTVQVPQEVWQHELQFYGIHEEDLQKAEQQGGQSLGEMQLKRRKLDEQEQILSEKAEKAIAASKTSNDEAELKRQQIYGTILTYMIEHLDHSILNSNTNFCFVGAAHPSGPMIQYPASYDVRARFNPVWLNFWFKKEFVEHCARFGFTVKIISHQTRTTKRRFEYKPASLTDIGQIHSFITIQIEATTQ